MLRSVYITNFQSHEKTRLEFAPGVNCIVGTSDSGKTAIIRALKWLTQNRPSGDSIRSNWGGSTNVILETEEGIVRRVKDKTDQYELLVHGENNLVFKAFGTSVPQEIVTFLNLSPLNFQGQLDSPFLLSDSSGQVAEFFNKVAGLEKIDTATQNINSQIRSIAADVKYKEAEEKSLDSQLTAYEDLDKFEIEVEVLEKEESDMNMLAAGVVRLRDSIKSINNCHTHLAEASRILALNDSVTTLVDDVLAMRTVETNATKLYLALERVKTTAADIEVETAMLTLDKPAEELSVLIKNRGVLRTDCGTLSVLLDQLAQTDALSLKWQGNALELEKQFNEGMGDVCILCNQPIKK